MTEEQQPEPQDNPFARSLAMVFASLAKCVEIALNSGNKPLLGEMRRCCDEMFDAAERAMSERWERMN